MLDASMGREKRRGNERFRRRRIGLPPRGVYALSVRLATLDANEERLFAPGLRSWPLHTHQWIASFGNPGNGQYREELRRAKTAIQAYIKGHTFPAERTLLRLDGQYGSGAVIADVADFAFVPRGKDYAGLDCAEVQARLHLPADQHLQSAESGVYRMLYDCPGQRLSENGSPVRVIVATHPAPPRAKKTRQVGVIRDGMVYELFWTNLPQSAFTAADVVSLYLHRGAFETALEDEDEELDPDRWCSHSAWGQEAWQIVAQW